jgi:hypothetical protein
MLHHHGDVRRRLVGRRRQPDRDAEKRRDWNVERDAHASYGTAQDHSFAMKFDVPHPLVRHGIVRREVKG